MSYKNRLKQLGERWEKEKPAQGLNVPDQKCQAEVIKAQLTEQDKEGEKHLIVVFSLRILQGKNAKATVRKRIDLDYPGDKKLDRASGISFLKKELKLMQVTPPARISALEAALKECIGCVLDIQLKTGDSGFQNIYFNRLVNAPVDEDEEEEEEQEEETEDEESEDEEDDSEEAEEDSEDDSEDEEEESDEEEEEEPEPEPEPVKRGRGRPKGSKNKTPAELTAERKAAAETAKKKKAAEKEEDEDDDDEEWETD